MKRNNFGYFISEGVRGVFLHGFMSFAAICIIVACLIIMGSFCLVLLNVNNMVVKLEQENEILVYVDETYSEAQAKSVGSQINMISNVLEAKFISREDALQSFISNYDDTSVFDGMDDSVLRDRFQVRLVDIGQMKETVSEIERIDGVAKVNAHYEISQGFITVQRVLNIVSAAIISVLFIVSVFIISNTVKLALFDRREEIGIMKMVGATNWFIRWPFVFEGFLLGLVGAGIAFFIEWGLYELIAGKVTSIDAISVLSIMPFEDVVVPMIVIFGATGFIVGVIGSLLSIRKFLKV